MWNAFRDAAMKIGNDMTEVLDGLTEQDHTQQRGTPPGRPSGQAAGSADGAPAAAPSAPAPAPSAPSGAAGSPTFAGGAAPRDAQAASDDASDALDRAAETLTRWLSNAGNSVVKVVDRVENALESGLDRGVEVLHGLVDDDATANDAMLPIIRTATEVDRIENALERVGLDTERCRTAGLPADELAACKETLVARLDDIEATCRELWATIITIARDASGTPDAVAVARQQVRRLEGLLERRDAALAAVLRVEATTADNSEPHPRPDPPAAGAAAPTAYDAPIRGASVKETLGERPSDVDATRPKEDRTGCGGSADGDTGLSPMSAKARSTSLGSELVHVTAGGADTDSEDSDLVEVSYPATPIPEMVGNGNP